jgi:hypothetical protein
MQTINNPMKTKDIQAFSQKSVNQASMTNEWSIYDAYNEQNQSPSSQEAGRKEIDLEAKIKLMESKVAINADQSVMINSSSSSMMSILEEVGASSISISQKLTTQTTKTQKDDITMVSIF